MDFSREKVSVLGKQKEKKLFTFLVSLGIAAALFVPYMIMSEGYFTFFGDFNVQQIPFYQLCHKAVREGNIYWNFNTDLGANFIGSYAFYLLGSPFFYLTLPFPNSFVPYLMGPLLILKFALAALTAYLFIRRFTKLPETASLCGILYAFSGFSVYNIFFNHFHEAIILFPLLLLSLELLITENRRGAFAVTVALCAAANYFFFFGMAVFCLIYFTVRVLSGNIKLTLSRFFGLAFEAVAGLLMSAVLLIPAILAITGNSRITDFMNGWSAIVYGKESIYTNIIQCFFFPPDLPARPVFFPQANVKWSSLGGWLPLFGMTGVFAFFRTKKNNWLRRVIGICIFMAMVPILNSAFYAFNTSYYARWFYMPILLMCLMTAEMFEDKEADFRYGFGWTLGITLAFAAVIGFFPQKVDGKTVFGLFTSPKDTTYIARFFTSCGIAIISLAVAAILLSLRKKNLKKFLNASVAAVAVVSIVYGNVFIATGRSHSYEIKEVMIDHLIEGQVDLPDTGDYRVDVYGGVDNTGMYLGLPTINAFHSVVPGSIMEFYEYLGIERSVGSRPDTSYPALRSLLSVKYLLNDETLDPFTDEYGDTKMPGYKYLKFSGGYNVYKNENFIGYGFSYDKYMTYEYCDNFDGVRKSELMLNAILLTDEQIRKYRGYMTNIETSELPPYIDYDFSSDAEALAQTSAYDFEVTNTGFSATVSRNRRALVFFSVPYDEGWSATVNGNEVEIEKVNVGFMAVPVDSGLSEIEFTYRTPGLDVGIYVSLSSLIAFLIYMIICGIYYHKRPSSTRYPEGTEMLEKWQKEVISDGVYLTGNEEDGEDEAPGEPSLLDKLDSAIKSGIEEKKDGDGFSINFDAFKD